MKRRFIYWFSFLSLFALVTAFSFAQTGSGVQKQISDRGNAVEVEEGTRGSIYKPEAGYVPDEETAIAIAVAVWNPIYGRAQIKKQKPYRAILKDGVWTVTGSLPSGMKGGVAEADISKDDGRILRVIHGK